MTEQQSENLEAIRIPGIALDQAVLDAALKELNQGLRMERVGETGLKRDFGMRMVMDKRSGRILEATTEAAIEAELDPDRTVVTVAGQFTQKADADGRITEENMVFQDIKIENVDGLTEKARENLKKLLASWRDKHNAYIGNSSE